MELDSAEKDINKEEAVPIEVEKVMESFWDWPLSEAGVAKVLEYNGKVTVTLDFSCLKHSMAVRTLLRLKYCNFCRSW